MKIEYHINLSLWATCMINYFRGLTDLEWLFLNGNQLTTLDEQLPQEGNKLALLHAGNNRLQKLPQELRNFIILDSLFFQHNELLNLGGTMQRARKLKRLHLNNNKIQEVSIAIGLQRWLMHGLFNNIPELQLVV